MSLMQRLDRQHRNYHFWYLVVLAFVSGLMLIAGFFDNSPSGLPKAARVLLASVSMLASTVSYLSIDRFRYAYPLLGFSTVAYAVSSWAFGIPSSVALLIGSSAIAYSVISWALKRVEDGTRSVD